MVAMHAALLLSASAASDPPSVEEILQKIAESQSSAQAARTRVVYTQYVHAKLPRANGKLAREEKRTYTATPTEKGFARKLEKLEGWYESKGERHPYSQAGFKYKGLDIDGDLINDVIDAWTGNDGSKDGVGKNLFPLTAEDQQNYSLQRAGPYRLSFAPRARQSAAWKGDLTVDPATLQLRNINSTLVNSTVAYKIPMPVKMIFGISLKQVGYSVTYDKTIEDLWFPVTSGTEFRIRLLFGYARTVILSLKNYVFCRASAESTIRFGAIVQ